MIPCLLPGVAVGQRQPAAKQTASAPAEKPTPNIIMIMIDALRADGLGVYGNRGALSPSIDALAAEGVTFERTIAQAPWTLPSVVSLFCSRYPAAHGITSFRKTGGALSRKKGRAAPPGRFLQTLAESLQGGGYGTAAFVANPYLRRGVYVTQGFDHYDASFADNTTPGRVINDAAITWLKQQDPSKPFFIYLHYMDVHGPYDAGPKFLDDLLDAVEKTPDKHRLSAKSRRAQPAYIRRMSKRVNHPDRHKRLEEYREYWVARYEAGIREMDHYVAALRTSLQEMGLWDDAYVIVTADHGEALGEHDLWHHGLSAHHTDLHIPLILRWPGVLPAGERVTATIRLIDLMPTILEQLHLAPPSGIQGISLSSLIAGHSSQQVEPAFAEAVKHKPNQRAVYLSDWKLMTLSQKTWLLYHLSNDPQERQDVADQHPEIVSMLRGMLKDQAERNAQLVKDVDVERAPLDAEDLKRLKSLGYIN